MPVALNTHVENNRSSVAASYAISSYFWRRATGGIVNSCAARQKPRKLPRINSRKASVNLQQLPSYPIGLLRAKKHRRCLALHPRAPDLYLQYRDRYATAGMEQRSSLRACMLQQTIASNEFNNNALGIQR